MAKAVIMEEVATPNVELSCEMTFKTTPALEKTIMDVARDNDLSADILINNALLDFLYNKVAYYN